ncbi:MAG: AraC family transcriptional regulator, partial [Paenibacillus sp.]|nr:AraC family transcriptional regulator [Paenibacillus sp.]
MLMALFLFADPSLLEVKWANVHKGNISIHNVVHRNPYYELIMVTEGPVYLKVGSEKLTLETGEAYLLTPWQQHQGWKTFKDTAGFFWVQFAATPEPETIESWAELKSYHRHHHPERAILRTVEQGEQSSGYMMIPQRFLPARRFELLGVFERLIDLFLNPQGYYRFRMSLHLGQLMEMLACDALEKNDSSQPISTSYILYRNMVNFLDEWNHCDFPKTEMEKYFSRKYEYLCAIFKKYAGMTMSAYINQLRIQRSKHLLRTTEETVAKIAGDVGY